MSQDDLEADLYTRSPQSRGEKDNEGEDEGWRRGIMGYTLLEANIGRLLSQVLFYHSNCKVPGVYGLATVHKEGYPDCECFLSVLRPRLYS
jgi:predicted RNA-binding protein with PUA-like domain